MKKLILLSLVALCTSCIEEHISEVEIVAPDLYATIETDDHTKTEMDEHKNVLWSANDQILAFMKYSLGIKYKLDPKYVGKTSGYFTKVSSSSSNSLGAGVELDHNIAYYPYCDDVYIAKENDDYILDLILPSEQTYVGGSFGNGASPMVAVSEDYDLAFKNLCGGLKLKFTGKDKVKSITVAGNNNEKLSGSAIVTAYANSDAPEVAMSTSALTYVTLNCDEYVQLKKDIPTEFIIIMPPTVFSKGFSVTVLGTNGNKQTFKTENKYEITRSSLFSMSAREVVLEKEYTDLSVNGTANSYIVSKVGGYKFVPTKGNSNESVGSIATVEVLWETFGTADQPNTGDVIQNVIYKNGYICFDTPAAFVEGNALIAAKNASGEILWSWHIWLTDYPQEQEYYSNTMVMDRNLGSTSATPGDMNAVGLLYQWGRKDPFLNVSSYESRERAASTLSWPEPLITSSAIGVVDYAVLNPTTYIRMVSYSASNEYDWLYTSDATLWNSTKTIYDPCPQGWRVPETDVWLDAMNGTTVKVEYDATLGGANLSGVLGDDSTIWYPATPLYNGSSYSQVTGSSGNNSWWTTTPYINKAKTKTFAMYAWGEVSMDQYCAQSNALALPIRCVKGEVGSPRKGEYKVTYATTNTSNSSNKIFGWINVGSLNDPDPNIYDGVYQSNNYNQNNSCALMYIDIVGYDTFEIYVRSDGEPGYDYLYVSNLDCELNKNTSDYSTAVKATTRNKENAGTSINSYKSVKFDNIGGGPHRITIMYKKDSSTDKGTDRGYVVIPRNQ